VVECEGLVVSNCHCARNDCSTAVYTISA